MALQGTLGAFALADVLRLLGATGKVGHLGVRAGAVSGSVWLDGGVVVAVASSGTAAGDPAPAALCELLRATSGTFAFEAAAAAGRGDDVTPDVSPVAVAALLADADAFAARWQAVDGVAGDPDTEVTLAPGPPTGAAALTPDRWRVVVAVGGGGLVGDVLAALGGSTFAAGELLAAATSEGLVQLHAPRRAVATAAGISLQDGPTWPPAPGGPVSAATRERSCPEGPGSVPRRDDGTEVGDAPAVEAVGPLAALSPSAARAVAATAPTAGGAGAGPDGSEAIAEPAVVAVDEATERLLVVRYLASVQR